MTWYLIRRVAQAVVVILLVTVITYIMLHFLPGGPARALLGPRATEDQVRQFAHANGYDRALPVQYWQWLDHLLHGDLGFSIQRNQTVSALLADALPKTLVLYGFAVALAVIVAIPVGLFQGARRNGVTDHILTGLSVLFYSTPAYFLGLVLILVFAVSLHLFPPSAPSGSIGQVLSQPNGLVLPVVSLSLLSIAQFSRYMRSSVIDNLVQDYVRTARAKGASEARILFRHITRNAVIPIATLVGLQIPVVFAGALITESVFNYPGMGLLFWQSAQTQDYPVLLGVIVVVATASVVGSLLADLAYAALDPRVRLAGAT